MYNVTLYAFYCKACKQHYIPPANIATVNKIKELFYPKIAREFLTISVLMEIPC